MTKALLAGLCFLAALCGLPRPSAVHLLKANAGALAVQQSTAPTLLINAEETAVAAPHHLTKASNVDALTFGGFAIASPRSAFEFPAINWTNALIAAYVLGCAITVARMIAGFVAARRLRHNAMPA